MNVADMILVKDEREIERAVQAMGREVAAWHERAMGRGCRGLTVVGVLNAAFVLTADLCRAIERVDEVGFLKVQRTRVYELGRGFMLRPSVLVCAEDRAPITFKDRAVLVVDVIIDSGETMATVKRHVMMMDAREVAAAALFARDEMRVPGAINAWDMIAWRMPAGKFLVGYGLDDENGAGRGLRAVYEKPIPEGGVYSGGNRGA